LQIIRLQRQNDMACILGIYWLQYIQSWWYWEACYSTLSTQQLIWTSCYQLSTSCWKNWMRNHNSLLLCELLVNALIDDINRRFEHLTEKHDVQLAAVANPKFKLDWLSDDIQKGKFIEILKVRVHSLANRSTTAADTYVMRADLDNNTPRNDFFSSISAAWQQRMASSKDDLSAEVDRYLNDCSSDLSSLNAYPHIKQLYIALNTGLHCLLALQCTQINGVAYISDSRCCR